MRYVMSQLATPSSTYTQQQ